MNHRLLMALCAMLLSACPGSTAPTDDDDATTPVADDDDDSTSDDDDATSDDDDATGDDDDATGDDDDDSGDDDDSAPGDDDDSAPGDDDDSAPGDDDDSASGLSAAFTHCASGGKSTGPSGMTAVICTGPLPTGANHTSSTPSGSFTLESGPITRIAP